MLRLSEDQMLQAQETPILMIPGWSRPGCLWDHEEARVGGAQREKEEDEFWDTGWVHSIWGPTGHVWPSSSEEKRLSGE